MRWVLLALVILLGAPHGASAQRLTPGLATALTAPVQYVTIADRTNYTRGSYVGYLSDFRNPNRAPYNLPAIGFDFLTVNAASFQAQGAGYITWNWPSTAQGKCPNLDTGVVGGPCGYLHVAYGCYDGSVAQTPITARTVASISTFRSSFDVSYDPAAAEYFGGLHELYLWSDTNCANFAARQLEIGMFTHASTEARAFAIFNSMDGGNPLGVFTDPDTGVLFNVYNVANVYLIFLPQCPGNANTCPGAGGDYRVGTFNWKAAIAFLQANTSLINSSWYIRGVAMGFEPTQLTGWARINRYTVDLQ